MFQVDKRLRSVLDSYMVKVNRDMKEERDLKGNYHKMMEDVKDVQKMWLKDIIRCSDLVQQAEEANGQEKGM